MKRSNHISEEELTELLQQMPKVRDERSMDEIYSLVMNEMDEPYKRKTIKKRRRYNVWPALATAAILCLTFILGSTLLNSEQMNIGLNAKDGSTDQLRKESNSADLIEERLGNNNEEEYGITGFEEEPTESVSTITYFDNNEKRAVFSDQLSEDETVLTIGIPDDQVSSVIPISIIVNKDNGVNLIEQTVQLMNEIDETKLSLLEYYPFNGTLYQGEDSKVNLNLNGNHGYDLGSAIENIFFESLDTLRFQGLDKVYLYTDSKPGLFFSHSGNVENEYIINQTPGNGYWLYSANNLVYTTPAHIEQKTISSVLEAMKVDLNGLLKSSIPNNLSFTVSDGEVGQLVITFAEDTDLSSYKNNVNMIEAIVLTARDFGYSTVLFENTGINQLDVFNFNESIPVPIAPNLVGEKK